MNPSRVRMNVKSVAIIATIAITGVVAMAGILYYQCSASGGPCFGGPVSTPGEQAYLERYAIQTAPGQQNPTVLTLWINNIGTLTVRLSSLSINDLTGDGASVSLPISVSISLGEIGTVTVDTSASGFYFTSGHSYSVSVWTAENRFTFTVDYT